jgi:hypothetical protein
MESKVPLLVEMSNLGGMVELVDFARIVRERRHLESLRRHRTEDRLRREGYETCDLARLSVEQAALPSNAE